MNDSADKRPATPKAGQSVSQSMDRDDTLRDVPLDAKAEEAKGLADEKSAGNSPRAPDAAEDYPDGGLRAWLVVLGAVCSTMVTFGSVNSWGAYQGYYEQNLLSDVSPSSIAWIGSIQYSLTFLPSLFVGRLFDLGYFRGPLAAASALLVGATFLVAECTQYWHFVLCQGIAIGISCGVIFGPTISVVSHWFKRRRQTTLGITAVGSSIGGTVFPIAFRHLVEEVGFKWTMRIIGFILMGLVIIPNLALRRRLPPVNVSGGLFHFRPFLRPALFMYTLAGFMCFLGLYTVLTYIDVSAVYKDIPEDFSFYLVSIANASSALGRIGSGLLADRLGPLTLMIPMTLLAGVLTYVWPFAASKGSFIAIAIFYGIGSGTFVSLLASPVIALGAIEDVGRRFGLFMTILALGALAGPPISGAINDATDGFVEVGVYAGSCVIIAVVAMVMARRLALGGWKGKF